MQRLVLTSRDFSELNPLDLRDPQTKFTEDPDYLYEKLRWIRLQGFSSEYLPNDYGRGDTIAIDLKHSLLQLVWKQPQVLFPAILHLNTKLAKNNCTMIFVIRF